MEKDRPFPDRITAPQPDHLPEKQVVFSIPPLTDSVEPVRLTLNLSNPFDWRYVL